MNTMTKCLLAVIVTFLPFMAVAYDPSQGACSSTNPYHYGDPGPDAGIVFYIDGGGCNGMEAQPYDVGANSANAYQGIPKIWSEAVTTAAAYNITPITTALSCSTTAPSSSYCWHLPDVNNLNKLADQKIATGCTAPVYWSSSGAASYPNMSKYKALLFASKIELETYSYTPLNVRSIRSF